MMEHILIISLTRMGDLIQTSPLLRSLRETYPSAQITVLVLKEFSSVAHRLPVIDKVLEIDLTRIITSLDANSGGCENAYQELRVLLESSLHTQFDAVINLSHTRQSATLASLLQAKQRIGMHRDQSGILHAGGEWQTYLLSVMQDRSFNPYNLVEIYNHFSPKPHLKNYSLDFMVTGKDQLTATRLLKNVNVDPSRPYVVLHPGTSHISRCWPADRFAELSNVITSHGLQVVLTGSESEIHLCEKITAMSMHKPSSLAGKTDVGTLAAILRQAKSVVSGDTGTIHIAAAVGTKTVGIYLGPASAKDTGPYGNGHTLIEADIDCAPCSYQKQCAVPYCQNHVEVCHVAPFVMDSMCVPATETLKGVRVYRTSLTSNGAYNLISLNEANRIKQSALLSFYRWFWNALLSGYKGFPPSYPGETDEVHYEHHRLTEIYESGEDSMRYAASLLADRESRQSKENVRTLLTGWQNQLAKFQSEHALWAPFARFLNVRLSFSRTHRPDLYVSDLYETFGFFRRGMELLSRIGHQKQKARVHRAVAG